jgi:hypothetical protein
VLVQEPAEGSAPETVGESEQAWEQVLVQEPAEGSAPEMVGESGLGQKIQPYQLNKKGFFSHGLDDS